MKILFCTSNKLTSRLIRLVTWSDWSHVGLIDGNEVIDAKTKAIITLTQYNAIKASAAQFNIPVTL